jgi:CheY-like chemotaxis protein
MDIQLPEISGLEVTKWLKEDDELSHIPVVAVTAFAMKGDEERIREGGCEAYISKPISVCTSSTRIIPVAGKVDPMTARILVVDDIEANVRLLEAKLSAEYYEVLTASMTGPTALAWRRPKARHHPAGRHDARHGRLQSAAAEGRFLETRHIPVVLVTALDGRADRIRGWRPAPTTS